MSYKEVTQLRKDDHLDEAIQMAETDLERKRDYWTLTSLFWCLNDLYKTETGEEKVQTVNRMCSLAQELEKPDEIINKCLDRAKISIDPIFEVVKTAKEKAKEGDAYKSYLTISKIYASGELPNGCFQEYGWVIYEVLHKNPKMKIMERKKMLMRYLKLNLDAPSLLHSLILREAVAIEKSEPLNFLFSAFLDIWDLANLRDEDWEGAKNQEGKKLPSLVEKMIAVYVKEMMITPKVSPSDDFLDVLDRAVEKWPGNVNILRDRALISIKLGDRDEAIKLYKGIILEALDKYYLWSELAELVEDEEIKIALLCKALHVESQEEYLGNVRLALVKLLILKEMFGWAKSELNRVKKIYEGKRWKLPSEYAPSLEKIPAETKEDNPNVYYEQYLPKADDYIFSALPSQLMIKIAQNDVVKNNRNNGKRKRVVQWFMVGADHKQIKIMPNRVGLSPKMRNGQCFHVRMHNRQPVLMAPIDGIPNVDWIKKVKGNIKIETNRDGKRFGFIQNCYVSEDLLKGITKGAFVSGIAVQVEGGRWSVCTLSR